MKKYVKPELFCESFELAQHIAACDYDSNDSHDDVKTCWFTGYNKEVDGVITIFAKDTCTVEIDDYCYTAAAGDSFNLFNS